MSLKGIKTSHAPAPIGHYSQAILSGNTLYVSGSIPIDPATGEMVKSEIKEQTHQVLKNIDAVLKDAGSGFSKVVKCDVFLKDLSDAVVVNEIYSEYFKNEPIPARVTVEVARLPKDSLIEISCIATA